MKQLLIHAWALHKCNGTYYISYTHWIYIREIAKYFDKLMLLSPVKDHVQIPSGMKRLSDACANADVEELPWFNSYSDAIKHVFTFRGAYKRCSTFCTHVYVRYPTPFGWLSMYYFKPAQRIFHFVGDPVHTIKTNPDIPLIKRYLKAGLFLPEHKMYLRACRDTTRVFTNGEHLQKKLSGAGIRARALVSSTLTESDFYFDKNKEIDANAPKLLHAGYLRKAKGLDTLLDAFKKVHKKLPLATLTVAGEGEQLNHLKQRIAEMGLSNQCRFAGHIEDRGEFNQLLRSHDIFVFTSISEGSPRVVMEAMANGTPVVATPVGSLPGMFRHGYHVLFAAVNDSDEIAQKIMDLLQDTAKAKMLGRNAFDLVKQHTLQTFIRKIFIED